MTDKPELKPCPFCGGDAEFEHPAIEAAVRCRSCGTSVTESVNPTIISNPSRARELEAKRAVAKWNTRPSLDVEVKPLAWEGESDSKLSDTMHGTYILYKGENFYVEYEPHKSGRPCMLGDLFYGFPELDDAIQEANRHNRETILSELSPQPPLSPQEGWQPIETAPKDVLIDIWLSDGVRWCDCYHDRITDTWRTSRPSGRLLSIQSKFVTHWMNRPQPPAGGSDHD